MAQFLIFLATVLALAIVALALAYVASRVHIAIKRRESVFDIEKETHEKIKKRIKEEKEDER